VVNVVLDVVWGQAFGIAGVAWSVVATNVVLLLGLSAFACAGAGVSWWRLLGWSALPFVAGVVAVMLPSSVAAGVFVSVACAGLVVATPAIREVVRAVALRRQVPAGP
jgi:Na+-driven multidrug efflux pump